MDNIYFADWAGENWKGQSGREAVAADFEVQLADDIEILFAWYTYENYSGDAFVLFRQGDTLYEVNGSHCSCYGLEDQWVPEVVNPVELRQRVTGRYDLDSFRGYRWHYDMDILAREALLAALDTPEEVAA